ncbi:MAG: toxin-antitoxin system HicB family antitoxin [archaeon]
MGNINIIIPDELHKELKLQAFKENKSLKELIIEQLDKETRKVRL